MSPSQDSTARGRASEEGAKSSSGWVRVVWDTLTIIVFLGLLWLPTLDDFFHVDSAPMPVENRRLARWPAFKGIGQGREYVAGLESYFNDHFGFRKRLIRWNNHWKEQLFPDTPNKDVLVGTDGWLFCSSERMIDHWTRQMTWSEQDLENWRRLLEMRRDWLQERGIKYIFVLAPDKHIVYPEYLPDWLQEGAKPSKVQQLVKYMKDHSTVAVLDLSKALIDAKKIHVTYLKTDTHWNFFGGFVAYRALLQALAPQMPGLEPLPLDAYTWKPVAQAPGDLAKKMGRQSSQETEAVVPVPVGPRLNIKEIYDPVRFPHHGPKESRPCFTLNKDASGKAMVFHDSFACTWYKFLGQNFGEVDYIWQYDWDRPLIEREKPDVVIDEMLERFFNLEDPVELAHKDLASETNSTLVSR